MKIAYPIALAALALAGCSRSSALPAPDNAPVDAVRLAMPQSDGAGFSAIDPKAKGSWIAAPDGASATYGYAGQPPLLTVACRSGLLMVTRHSPAEVGAQALFALQGGGRILRLPVDATAVPGQRGYIWQGSLAPGDPGAAVFQSAFNGTLPGGGMIKVTAGEPMREVLRRCKANPAAAAPVTPLGGTDAPASE
ncbi:hypothetical protein [Novosphingobium olei]|uniref:hypothetical protein n=1 Tax=Novosphingobium olei TaxID=2728851 RepID=UPI0030864F2F|nr:hypothetical protein NSDW_21840 [Novosphingobium olei]